MNTFFKITLLFLFLTFFSNQLSSQIRHDTGNYYFNDGKWLINTADGYNINSNSLTNAFYKTILNGRYIDSSMKANVSTRLKPENILGGDILVSTGFSHIFKQSANGAQWFYFADIADREHLDLRFTDDLMNFTLFGNKMFAGNTATLGNFDLNLLRYQQLRLGIIAGDTSGNMFGFGISYLKGEQNLKITSGRNDIYTSATGDLLAFSADISILQTDSDNTGFGAFNGNGLSADFFSQWKYDLFIGSKKRPGYFRFALNDFGMIKWNNNSLTYIKDTSYYYSGFYMDSLEEFNTLGTQVGQLIDSIYGTVKYGWKKKSYTTPLPSWIILSLTQQHSDKLTFEAGGIYRYYANYYPYGYLKESFLINDYITASLTAGYGGYGGFGVGAEGKFSARWFQLAFGLTNIEGIVNPGKTGGNGGYITLRGRW